MDQQLIQALEQIQSPQEGPRKQAEQHLLVGLQVQPLEKLLIGTGIILQPRISSESVLDRFQHLRSLPAPPSRSSRTQNLRPSRLVPRSR